MDYSNGKAVLCMLILRQPSRPRALLLPLSFQFCFVAIIKKERALSNKIIAVCSAANANGFATFVPTAG